MSPGPFDAGIPVLTEVLKEIPPALAPAPEMPSAPAFKPAVWRTGAKAAVAAPAPVIDLVVPADADVQADIDAGVDAEAAGDDAVGAEAATADVPEAPMETATEAPGAPADLAQPIDLAAIEQVLCERIVQQLTPRVDALVAEHLDRLLLQLATGLQAGLADSVTQAVAASVRQELSALQAPKT